MSQDIPPELMNRIIELIFARQKIAAIRLYRENRAASLADSKQFIERLTEELRDKYPGSFTPPPARSCAGTLAVVAIASAISCAALSAAVFKCCPP